MTLQCRSTKTVKKAALVLLVGLAVISSAQEIKLEHHLEHFTTIRNPTAFDSTAWFDARNYIFDQFRSYGLNTQFQPFNTSVRDGTEDKTALGENVIGIAEGTPGGPVMLVGADYDTNLLQHSPLEDNGAGVAVLLEVARNYMTHVYNSKEYNVTRTVIFVAFDINTREYDDGSAGQPGSFHFLHQWLWPYLDKTAENFMGAFILDSISKYNVEEKSQVLPTGFERNFPEANEEIVKRGKKGDFLALITRKSERNSQLGQTLFDNYNNDRKARMFRLLELTVTDGAEVGDSFNLFNHQANFHFWTFQPGSHPMPLPAILLTDTDVFRKPSDICQSPCSASAFLTRPRNAFMTKTTEALVQTLADILTNRQTAGNSGFMVLPSWLFMVLMVIISKTCP